MSGSATGNGTSSTATHAKAKPVAAHSKTITNDKAKTTLTYRKEVMPSGTVNRTQTKTDAL